MVPSNGRGKGVWGNHGAWDLGQGAWGRGEVWEYRGQGGQGHEGRGIGRKG